MSLFARIADIMTDERSAWAAGIGVSLSPVLAALETYVFGDLLIIWFVLLLVGLDFITGWRVAWKTNAVNSSRLRAGAEKLAVYLILIAAAHAVASINNAKPDDMLYQGLRLGVGGFISACEMLSIIENAAKLGVKLPNYLTRHLKVIRDGDTKDSTDKNPEKQG